MVTLCPLIARRLEVGKLKIIRNDIGDWELSISSLRFPNGEFGTNQVSGIHGGVEDPLHPEGWRAEEREAKIKAVVEAMVADFPPQ